MIAGCRCSGAKELQGYLKGFGLDIHLPRLSTKPNTYFVQLASGSSSPFRYGGTAVVANDCVPHVQSEGQQLPKLSAAEGAEEGDASRGRKA